MRVSVFRKYHLLLLGIALWAAACFYYAFYGYHSYVAVCWLASLIVAALSFCAQRPARNITALFNGRDAKIVWLLLLLFAPMYLLFLYTVPWQINTDEIAIAQFARDFVSQERPDLFAPTRYFGFPGLIFYLIGRLANLIGGTTFFNVRVVHAAFGVLILFPAYAFFRQFGDRLFAAVATALLMSHHALVAISRMASRNNVAVLNEVAALLLLLFGLKNRSYLFSFLGGMVAGISFYHYPPARLIFIVWLFFSYTLLYFRRLVPHLILGKLTAVSILGFLMVVTPMIIATTVADEGTYGRSQLLIFVEGREHQQGWYSASNMAEGIRINIANGLTMFNRPLHDQAYIYPNYGHGFVDPMTGVLIWIGLASLLIKKKKSEADIFTAAGFLFLWMIFVFIVGQAPNYTRLFVMIPFIALVATRGLEQIAAVWIRAGSKLRARTWKPSRTTILASGAAAIVIWNMSMFSDFVLQGVAEGNDVGGTGRYVEERTNQAQHAFYIVADTAYPYFSWGDSNAWEGWIAFFAHEEQHVEALNPDGFIAALRTPPFTLFMSGDLWHAVSNDVTSTYSNVVIHDIVPNGQLVAAEISR